MSSRPDRSARPRTRSGSRMARRSFARGVLGVPSGPMQSSGVSLLSLERRLRARVATLKPGRTNTVRGALFPFYAGYSERFVREALDAVRTSERWTVLDPWNGAGTTTTVADELGCESIGLDLNPVATLVSSARLARWGDIVHSKGLLEELIRSAHASVARAEPSDPLLDWLPRNVVSGYRALERAIVGVLGTSQEGPIDLRVQSPPPLAAFFLVCLMRSAKSLTRTLRASNPTWLSPDRISRARTSELTKRFANEVQEQSRHARAPQCDRAPSGATITLGDARSLPLRDASVDTVVTSPPYCTRIDYFRATRFELAALGISVGSPHYRGLREAAMGTTLVRHTPQSDLPALPKEVTSFLAEVASHPSKDSASYYFANYRQYFSDSARALCEIARVLRPERTALLVVQTSYYKDVPVPLGDLFAAMGTSAGLCSRVVLRLPVRRVLANINSRARHYVEKRSYFEEIVACRRG